MLLDDELYIYKESSSRLKLFKVLLIRTILFCIIGYVLFHFINDKGGISKVNTLENLLLKEQLSLEQKKLVLENKKLIVMKIKGPNKDLDLIDQLVRKELGYSEIDEITIVDHFNKDSSINN